MILVSGYIFRSWNGINSRNRFIYRSIVKGFSTKKPREMIIFAKSDIETTGFPFGKKMNL